MDQLKNRLAVVLPLFALALVAPTISYAKGGSELMETAMDNIIFLLGGLVIIAALITIINMVFNFIDLQKLRMQQELGIEKEQVVKSLNMPSWKKMYDWMWQLVPKDKEKTIDLGHNYDGIRELDNKLPPWWVGLFWGTIIFAVVYMYAYEWGPSEWSSTQEYVTAMEEAEVAKDKFLSKMADVVDEKSVVFVDDPARLAAGKTIYLNSCAACHGPDGQGLVGPNFTDEYWIHGGSIVDIFSTIKYGVPEKGMISWSSQLKPASMQNVASYIQTLQGTNPPNPKAPEGTLYVAEEGEAAQDSTIN